jgi:hypothetical protein
MRVGLNLDEQQLDTFTRILFRALRSEQRDQIRVFKRGYNIDVGKTEDERVLEDVLNQLGEDV